MQKNIENTMVIGVDLVPPQNEMLFNLIDSIRGEEKTKPFYILSIQKKKNLLKQERTFHIKSHKYFSKVIQGVTLLIKFTWLKFNKRISLVNIVWSGFGLFDSIFIAYCQLLSVTVVYTVVTKRQIRTVNRFRNLRIVLFTQDLLKLLKHDRNKYSIITPAVKLGSSQYAPPKGNRVLFITVPFSEKEFVKRGIYLLFKTMKKIANKDRTVILDIVSRWEEGVMVLSTICNQYSLKNINILRKYITNKEEFFSRYKCLINLDSGDSVPLFPLSLVEAASYNLPIVTSVENSTTKIIMDSGGGEVVTTNPNEISDKIIHVIRNYSRYHTRLQYIKEKIFSYERFIEEYGKTIQIL